MIILKTRFWSRIAEWKSNHRETYLKIIFTHCSCNLLLRLLPVRREDGGPIFEKHFIKLTEVSNYRLYSRISLFLVKISQLRFLPLLRGLKLKSNNSGLAKFASMLIPIVCCLRMGCLSFRRAKRKFSFIVPRFIQPAGEVPAASATTGKNTRTDTCTFYTWENVTDIILFYDVRYLAVCYCRPIWKYFFNM